MRKIREEKELRQERNEREEGGEGESKAWVREASQGGEQPSLTPRLFVF